MLSLYSPVYTPKWAGNYFYNKLFFFQEEKWHQNQSINTGIYSEGIMPRKSQRSVWSGRKLLPLDQGGTKPGASLKPRCAGKSRGRAHGWALGCGPGVWPAHLPVRPVSQEAKCQERRQRKSCRGRARSPDREIPKVSDTQAVAMANSRCSSLVSRAMLWKVFT